MNPHTCNDPSCPNPTGLCGCGCGEATPRSISTVRKLGWVRGHPIRFIHGHHLRTKEVRAAQLKGLIESPISICGKSGKDNPSWKGGRTISTEGYVLIQNKHHPRANKAGYVAEHILVAEKTLNRALLPDEIVHHRNRTRSDNSPENLEVMTKSEHSILHATSPGGDERWFSCGNCGESLYRRPSEVKPGKEYFCTNSCQLVHVSRLTREGILNSDSLRYKKNQ